MLALSLFLLHVDITFELSGVKLSSLYGSGGGVQRRNELKRFVSCYSHVSDLLHIYEECWRPMFDKEYLLQGLFSATPEGL